MARWQWGFEYMQRWLKRITADRGTLEKLWCVKPFAALVVARGCWTFKRASVVRASARIVIGPRSAPASFKSAARKVSGLALISVRSLTR